MSRRNLRGGVIENAGSYNKAQDKSSSFAERANRLKTQFKKFSPEVPNSEARIKFNSASKAAYPVGLAAGVKFDTDLAEDRLYNPVYYDRVQNKVDAENRGDVEAEAKRAERNKLLNQYKGN